MINCNFTLLIEKHILQWNIGFEKDTMGEVKVPADKYWGAPKQKEVEIILKLVQKPVCL